MSLEQLHRRRAQLEMAVSKLEQFLGESEGSELDKAGVIQAFELTFELAWKLFQSIATFEGDAAPTPRSALGAAFRAGVITDEDVWLAMLTDRNLTSHTYRKSVADEIYTHIATRYAGELRRAWEQARRY